MDPACKTRTSSNSRLTGRQMFGSARRPWRTSRRSSRSTTTSSSRRTSGSDRLPAKYHDVGPRVDAGAAGRDDLRRRQVLLRAGRPTATRLRLVALRGPARPADPPRPPPSGFDRDEVKVTAHHLRRDAPGLLRPEGPPRGHGRQPHRGVALLPELPPVLRPDVHSRPRTRSSPCSASRPTTTGWSTSGAASSERPPHPAHASSRCGTRSSPPTRSAATPARGVRAVVLQRDPAVPRPAVDPRRDDYWDPFFEACDETGTVINMHIGSSSKMPSTSADAPPAVGSTLTFGNAMSSMVDWLMSGVLVRFPDAQARLLRGPDRLDPLHPRAGRQGVGGQPGVGRRGRQGPRAAVRPTTTARSTAASSTTRTGSRVARRGRRRQHHVRDRLPALRQHVAAHARRSAEKLMGHLDAETSYKIVRGNAIKMLEPRLRPDLTPMADDARQAAHRRRAGSRPAAAPTTSSTRPPRRSSGQAPDATAADADAAAAAARGRVRRPGRATTPEDRAALLRPCRRPARQARRRAGAARAGRDRRHAAGRQDDAGAQAVGPLPALRAGRRRAARHPAAARQVMPTTALAPGGHHRRHRRTARRSAWSACITPYNFPIVNMAGKIGPALAMGNTVVVKPAPQDPLAVIAAGRGARRGRASRPASSTSSPAQAPTPAEALVDVAATST